MDFVCGVVEGFYGIPWRVSERKELFGRLNSLQLNTYMYAPKDDTKHRKLWREKYTSSEKDVLKVLIDAAAQQCVTFVYSISPGLDIVFSSPADITALREKLEQVYNLGCNSFALLFDDIDPELCLADKSEYSTFGDAQVHISNKLYEWFDKLKLVFFCPTEYCITRAKPDVETSTYLQCLGKNLNNKIHIMWTGPKVVSETIDVESICTLSKVLNRKPLIWDNIHANDYDQRRVFLGPFKGRPMELYEHTSGILTNPNCEFECNFIAIHSLGTWLRVAKLVSEKKRFQEKTIAEDIAEINKDKINLFYDSNLALNDAVECWMELFQLSRDTIQTSNLHACKLGTNSLVGKETPNTTEDENKVDIGKAVNGNSNGNADSDGGTPKKKKSSPSKMTTEDVLLLCDLFHLPYEHGERGSKLINDFKWLKYNAIDYEEPVELQKAETWSELAKEFNVKCQLVDDMFRRFLEISNKRILEQLFPYVYDVKETVFHLSKFVKWLGSVERQKGNNFLPNDPEAWFYRGGIAGEMERLLPTPGTLLENSDRQTQLVMIRPYIDQDEKTLYELCRNLSAVPEAYIGCTNLAGDTLLGAYLKYSRENIFVVVVDDDVSGFIAANVDGRNFYNKVISEWLPDIRREYIKPGGDPDIWTAKEHMINRLYHPQFFTPNALFDCYEAVITMRLLPEVQNIAICSQALMCVKLLVEKPMCCYLNISLNTIYQQLYKELGFSEIITLNDKPDDLIIYGLKVK